MMPIAGSGAVMTVAVMFLRQVLDVLLVIPIAAIVYVACLFFTRSIRPEHLCEVRRMFHRRASYVEISPPDA
jgi:hypothetical protein